MHIGFEVAKARSSSVSRASVKVSAGAVPVAMTCGRAGCGHRAVRVVQFGLWATVDEICEMV